ncbi:DUF6382 domain-containing protein [Paenibacillus sp. MER 99-2]|uniref:DUF6382 domain-containing protein n=1 Tax=Paenibacillus sp. MER 99-2 TaxID=2939572 RepID=UPI0020419006|nr:DUF6382 domain-containing protein [Paenibacillus sp. MER 99-2]MCM3172795.1 FHA domain-containing protein [Paenibacillus sp. MER 99-2]
MYGLTRDFIRNGGAFMVLEKPEGMKMESLSRVQTGMLTANSIPRLLPIHIREVDSTVTLQYDISGYKMLSQVLKSSRIEMAVLYGILYQIADTFTECRQYMLESRKLMLQEEYIFVKGSLEQGELGLVYVPLMDTPEVDSTPLQFRELVIRLMSHTKELQGQGIQRVLQLCDTEQWDVQLLRELLLELYVDEQKGSSNVEFLSSRSTGSGGVGKHAQLSGNHASEDVRIGQPQFSSRESYSPQHVLFESEQKLHWRQHAKNPDEKELDIVNRSMSSSSTRRSQRDTPPQSSQSNFGNEQSLGRLPKASVQDDMYDEPLDDQAEQKAASSKVTYILLGCMVGMALIWRFIYMEQPGETQMILSAALSVVLLAIAVWAWISKGRFNTPKGNTKRNKADQKQDSYPYSDSDSNAMDTSTDKKSTFFGLGKKRPKEEDEMFQENWRWNAPAPAIDQASTAAGYVGHGTSTRFQDLHTETHDNLTSQAAPITPSTSELPRYPVATEPTVNLQNVGGGEQAIAGMGMSSFYLERRSATGEHNERMDVRGASFVIGRSADMVQWVDTATGVSRAHVELSRNKTGYVIKDLGSVNGTILQGNPLAPYKEYPLQDGDTFTLADSSYTYRSVG